MSDETRILDLLVRWEELREQGQSVTPEELCGDSPELLDEVKRRVQHLQDMRDLLDTPPDRTVGGDSARSADDAGGTFALCPNAMASGSRYRPLRFHARGGLGEVLVAEDAELRRDVALKRIQEHHSANAESRRRFLREAEITGQLEHPGIVPVYGLVHEADGQPSYATRFIQGETFQDAIRHFHAEDGKPGWDAGERSLAFRGLLNRFVLVCNTVAYAHSRGVLHRDLKPANVMLGKYGETLVVDWGLAKQFDRTDAERSTGEQRLAPSSENSTEGGTETGQTMGTPAYMSPEQAEGQWDRVGPASDIYSLGATLYALLTGQTPAHGVRVEEALLRLRRGEFPRPRQVKKEEIVVLPADSYRIKETRLRPLRTAPS